MRKPIAILLALSLLCAGCTAAQNGPGTAPPTTTTTTPKPMQNDYSQAVVLTASYPDGKPNYTLHTNIPTDFTYRSAAAVLSAGGDNAAYSPMSLYFALMLLREGTSGTTRTQLDALLGSTAAEAKKQYERLYRDNEYGKLLIANSLWTTDKVTYRQEFVDAVQQNFYASLMRTQFGEVANGQMTKWVSDNTGGLLAPVFESNDLTVLELLNAIYMKAQWHDEFFTDQPGTFTSVSGEKSTVDYMTRTVLNATVWKTANATRVQLGTSVGAMSFVLPDEGTNVSALVSDADALQEALTGGAEQQVKLYLYLPKVDLSAETDLTVALRSLGCADLFSKPNPDLSGLIEDPLPLMISTLRQGVRLIWDEEGVTGGAYTEIAVDGTAMPPSRPELTLRFDRPFLYAATADNGDVIFTGTVTALG